MDGSGLGSVGRMGIMTAQALLMFPAQFMPRRLGEVVRQMYLMGIKGLPVVTIVGMFTGMVLGLQIGLELRHYNQEVFIGAGVMLSSLREMGPFMTGLILAACMGSSMAAQIGTMTVNDEVAALEIMSVNPVRYLVAPRMAAMVLMTPVLSFYACILSVIGGGIVAVTQLSVPFPQYIKIAMDAAAAYDLYVGLFKALLFGILITGISCFEGFSTRQGAVGVGRATRNSVIKSFVFILVVGYIITRLFYDL
jgi:phospholipid/cholesterol/gamma-HCH transport system permease protein